jgi:protein farnesyltransferase/geranylgeranyltransferase type-1 subunit alpha
MDGEDWEKEFVDVPRIPQADGPHPVAPINYASECMYYLIFLFKNMIRDPLELIDLLHVSDTAVMDLFRGFLTLQEFSERGLRLTSAVIEHNPAHYTIWCVHVDLVIYDTLIIVIGSSDWTLCNI